MFRIRRLARPLASAALSCLGGIALLGTAASALPGLEEDEMEAAAKAQVDELREMLTSRGIGRDMFQFTFQPLEFDRILVPTPTGEEKVYHYLTFYLRNQTANEAGFVYEHATRYNEVLQTIADEFNGRGPGVSRDGSGGLVVDTRAITDDEVRRVLQRDQLQPETRVARLTAWIEDENGSRFRAWNPFPVVGSDVDINDVFNFEDRGTDRQSAFYHEVREAVEERVGRRLLTVHELRQLQLPPYDPSAPGIGVEDWVPGATERERALYAQGEVYGVILFDRLPTESDRFSMRINGLSSYTRRIEPEHDRDELADYYNTRIQRRAYVIELDRPGDEYHMSLRSITMGEHGWRWVPAFMRLRLRRDTAYATYLLDNIRLERETTGVMSVYLYEGQEVQDLRDPSRTGPRLRNEDIGEIAEAFVERAITEEWPEILRLKQTYLESERGETESAYGVLMDAREIEAARAPVRERLSLWLEDIDRREESIEALMGEIETHLGTIPDLIRGQQGTGQ